MTIPYNKEIYSVHIAIHKIREEAWVGASKLAPNNEMYLHYHTRSLEALKQLAPTHKGAQETVAKMIRDHEDRIVELTREMLREQLF